MTKINLCNSFEQLSFKKPEKLFSEDICKLLITALLLNTLDWPCPRVQHSPPHHHRVNLGNLPGDVGLQMAQDGRVRAVDLGLQEAPEAEVEGGRGQGARRPLSAPQAPSTDHCVLKLVVQIPHVSTRKRSYI